MGCKVFRNPRALSSALAVLGTLQPRALGFLNTVDPLDTVSNCYLYKYEKHFPKMYRDVGMAVPKTTQTSYMDGTVQATQRTTQVTPSLHHFSFLLSAQSCFQYSDNKS